MPIKAAVMGLGNIGRYAIEALEIQPDFTCVGVIRRKESLGKDAHDLRGVLCANRARKTAENDDGPALVALTHQQRRCRRELVRKALHGAEHHATVPVGAVDVAHQ